MGSAFFLLFSNPAPAQTPLKIAIIDTGFCPKKSRAKNIKIETVIDLTDSLKIDCTNPKIDLRSSRFHGQLVMNEFLKFFDAKKNAIDLFPLIVFNAKGDQTREYWLKAIDWIKKNNIDVVITAAGFMTSEKLVTELPAIWFVPSGRVNPQIKKETSLFPQNLAPQKNLFIIGDFYDGRSVLFDSGLLFQDKIDYYFPSGAKGFVGTSRAVAEAGARAINLCKTSEMRDCLKKKSREYIDNLSRKKIQTF